MLGITFVPENCIICPTSVEKLTWVNALNVNVSGLLGLNQPLALPFILSD